MDLFLMSLEGCFLKKIRNQNSSFEKCFLCHRRGGSVHPVHDLAVVPDVSSTNLSVRRKERGKYGRLCSSVDGQRPLVAGHIGVNVARVDVVHYNVLPSIRVHLALVDPAKCAPANL